jgi:diguanylate cyclase (GGDEF)-like protein/PAS domain S-box-containing protein
MPSSIPAPARRRDGPAAIGEAPIALPAETRQALADVLQRMKASLPSTPLALKIAARLSSSASADEVLELLEAESGRGSTHLLAATLAGVAGELQVLRRNERRLREFFERSPVALAAAAWSRRWTDANPAFCAMLGWTRPELFERNWSEIVHPQDAAAWEAVLEPLRAGRSTACEIRTRLLHKDGSAVPVHALIGLQDARGAVEEPQAPLQGELALVIRDVSESERLERLLREKDAFLGSVLGSVPDCLYVAGPDGEPEQMNEAGLRMFGAASLEELRKTGLASLVLPRLRRPFQALHKSAAEGNSGRMELQVQALDGALRWLDVLATPLRDASGGVHAALGFAQDVSDRKRSAELIWKQANFDQLTGLPNRYMFQDRLGQELKKARRGDTSVALLLVDLDSFREVNETLGHEIGDSLLASVAKRLVSCVRESDTVARLGGDEFAIILPHLGTHRSAEQVARTVIERLGEVFAIGGETVVLSAGVGVTYFPTDARSIEGLMKNADQAMLVAKQQGRNRIGFFTTTLREEAQNRLRLVNDLRCALAEGQFRVHFQPIVDLRNGRVHGAEALLRWQHPTRGMVPPGAFIPLAEETGLIVGIGDWVFREATRWAKRWATRSGGGFAIAINQSPVQFRDRACVLGWLEHLDAVGLAGANITIEITEGLLLRADASTTELLQRLHGSGMRVALDDFGTGYSSLSYLHKFHVDTLKIDQSFVQNLHAEGSARTLSESIILMAHKLGLCVVAEGVESAQQREILTQAGCDYAQGFLFAPALPPEQFEAQWLAAPAAS